MFETKDTILLREIYDHLQDEESKEIYRARSQFSLTDDKDCLKDVIRKMTVARRMLDELKKHYGQDFILFGAGTWGKAILHFFPEIHWKCVVDNKQAGKQLGDYDIISFAELQKMENVYIVVAVYFKFFEIKTQLLEAGFSENDFLVLGEVAEEKQYFDLPNLNFSKDEVFVDGGGYDGAVACRFAEVTGYQYNKIYMFEPNGHFFELCQKAMERVKKCIVVQKGISDSAGIIHFIEDGERSRFAEGENDFVEVETITLDEYIDEKVTFIKMDIEGAELAALKGAEKIIRNQNPKLAISVYHRREDIWEIPKLLLKYNPDYKFFLRIYSFTGNDTVLYAV